MNNIWVIVYAIIYIFNVQCEKNIVFCLEKDLRYTVELYYLANTCGTSEGDHLHERRGAQGGSHLLHLLSGARHHVHHARRHSCLLTHLREEDTF